MSITYNGVTLHDQQLNTIVQECERHNIDARFAIVQAYFETRWGTVGAGKTNNNWAGITWFDGYKGNPEANKSAGGNRPANEGGRYVTYPTHDDGIKDWIYLLRPNNLYTVSGAKTIEQFVNGLFKAGGAKANYAASGYDHYMRNMVAIYNDMKPLLDNLDKGVDSDMTKGTAAAIIAEAQKMVGASHGSSTYNQMVKDYNNNLAWAIQNGGLNPKPRNVNLSANPSSGAYDWCAGFISVIAKRAGAIGTVGYEIAAERLGKHQHESRGSWLGRVRPKAGDLILFRWDGKGGWADHIGIVERVVGDTIHTIEGNTGSLRSVRRFTYAYNDRRITGYSRPKYRTSSDTALKKTVAELANEVLADKWGKGRERIDRLTQAGYDADKVQKEVNRILSNVEAKKSNEEVAKEVVKGEWGNNPQRSKDLIEAGYDVNAVQKLVNEILKQAEDTENVDVVEVEPVDKDRLNLKPNEFEIDGRVYVVNKVS